MMLIVMVKRESITFIADEIKDMQDIGKYFEIKPEGNWEKIILIEKEKPKMKS